MTAKKRAKVTGRAGNPVNSEWYSTPRKSRVRKIFTVTLDPTTVDLIKQVSERTMKPYSQLVEEAFLEKWGTSRADGTAAPAEEATLAPAEAGKTTRKTAAP